MSKVVITNKDNIIMAIGTNYSESTTEVGVVFLDGAGYGVFGQKVYQNVEVPVEVESSLYTYDGTTFAQYTSTIDKIKQEAIDAYTLELIEGGAL